ncbi:hypothetical protein TVAG_004740 [Trichomonas vaginalis G3]|uniref:Uncharacterized protein n=1 Tax=Trichomonas vaginalis (strain ATCC PRA-98 / G3) TaxID=412133 RepID=A2DT36_TRIV3|nr:hypothetical protein TVAGG3_0648720 [Trichomonas vaginalis G3]EAY16443.1 hypothetical protein TVAG_004740 [Trichomonas vaginalis G3]KAI5505691.1 hypothetical protein TVAGG3_0648720 [Trichomonas vaginalis G3]|eukprot:XP_001328666.1 hypothetical protein [Trichomonas vaginalis G3]
MSDLFEEENESIFKAKSKPIEAKPVQKPVTVAAPDGNLQILPVAVFRIDPNTQQPARLGMATILFSRKNTLIAAFLIAGNKQAIAQFVCNENISWTLQNSVYVYVYDTRNMQWLLQFRNPQEAINATVLALFQKTSKENFVTVFQSQANETNDLKFNLITYDLSKNEVKNPSTEENEQTYKSKLPDNAVKKPGSQYLFLKSQYEISFLNYATEQTQQEQKVEETMNTETKQPDNAQNIEKQPENQKEPEIEEEEVEEIIITDNTTVADLMNTFDERYEEILRKLNNIPTHSNKITPKLMDPNEAIQKLSELIQISERKDQKLKELQKRIDSFQETESNPFFNAISQRLEELAVNEARQENWNSDLQYDKRFESQLEKQSQSIDKEIEAKIQQIREQSRKDFEIQNKSAVNELESLKKTITAKEEEKKELINQIKAVAQDSALVKAGGNAEVEKLKAEISKRLKIAVNNLASDTIDVIESNFKSDREYTQKQVFKAVMYALQNSADNILNPDGEEEEEEEEEEEN